MEVKRMTNFTIVSIHAPAKGATSVPGSYIIGIIGFNPRSREGSDVIRVR